MSNLTIMWLAVLLASGVVARRQSELLTRDEAWEQFGVVWRGNASSSHDMLPERASYPASFNWCDINGTSYCTMTRYGLIVAPKTLAQEPTHSTVLRLVSFGSYNVMLCHVTVFMSDLAG